MDKRLSSGELHFRGKVHKVQQLGSGHYSSVYRIMDTSSVVKAFHRTIIEQQRGDSQLERFMRNSLSQYLVLSRAFFPVVAIHSVTEAKGDIEQVIKDRCCIIEYVERGICLSNWAGKRIEELTEADQCILGQVRTIFERSIREQILLDLFPENLRVRASGQVVIADFIEEPEDDDDFLANMRQRLKAWVEPSIINFLLADLPKEFNPLYN